MSHQKAGEYGTVATEESIGVVRWILSGICLYAAVALAVLPVAGRSGPEIPGITPFFVAGTLATELSTSFLLFVRFREARTWSLLLLGCAYLYAGSMAVFHLLTFPGAVMPAGIVVGRPESTAWAFLLWIIGFAALALTSILLEAGTSRRVAPDRVDRIIGLGVGAVLAAVCACVIAATVAVDRMPPLLRGASWTIFNQAANCLALAMMAAGIAIALLAIRERNVLFLWLSLALTAMFFANVLSLAGGGRYTIGWSVGRLSWVVSACVLFVFFMGQFARQQRLLSRARDMLERRVEERTADLVKTISQRDLLLREVHHRVKNNLQVVDSLIAMESRRVVDATAREAFAALRNRVIALGLVHQRLMTSDNFETFSIAAFLRELSDNLAASFAAAERGIAIVVEAEPVTVTLDFAIPVGLLTTELLSNAIKHAGAKTVTIEFRRCPPGEAVLAVGDDGEDAATH